MEYSVHANGFNTISSSVSSEVESCSLCDNTSGNCTVELVCVNETVTTNISNQEPWSVARSLALSCESSCDYPLPVFDIPREVTLSNYTLSATTLPPRVILYFKKARNWVTLDSTDQVHLEVNQSMVCSEVQCDPRCTKCLDGSCNPLGYVCPSIFLKLDKVTPRQLDLGETQLNVFILNDYDVDAFGVDAKVSGAGVKTLRSIPVEKIVAKDKDAVVLTVKLDESGTIDLLVKVTGTVAGKEVVLNSYSQIIVNAQEEELIVQPSQVEMDEIGADIDQGKEILSQLELEYQRKKADGYLVSELYDRVKYVRGLLQDAEKNLLDSKYIDARKTLKLVDSSLDDLQESLEEAPKEKKKIRDLIKDNALLITTVIGTLVAIIGFLEKNKSRFSKSKEKKEEEVLEEQEEVKEPSKQSNSDKKGSWFSVEEVEEKSRKKKRR